VVPKDQKKKASLVSPSAVELSKKPSTTTTTTSRQPTTASTKLVGDSESDKALNAETSKLNVTVEGLEKERNFYFDKLREIEILCQADDEHESALKQEILKILYATDENEEFQSPDTGDLTAQTGSISGSTTSAAGSDSRASSSNDRTLVDDNVDDLLASLGENQSQQSGQTIHTF